MPYALFNKQIRDMSTHKFCFVWFYYNLKTNIVKDILYLHLFFKTLLKNILYNLVDLCCDTGFISLSTVHTQKGNNFYTVAGMTKPCISIFGENEFLSFFYI